MPGEILENPSRCDSCIWYIFPGAGVGMRDNYEYVLWQVKPGFVIALDGDAGLLPDGIKGMRKDDHESRTDGCNQLVLINLQWDSRAEK